MQMQEIRLDMSTKAALEMKQVGLRFGPLGNTTAHLCVDMQNIFALETGWHTPWMARVLPMVTEIVARHPAQTIFTRFIPPHDASERDGSWRRYFEQRPEMTQSRIDPRGPARFIRAPGKNYRQTIFFALSRHPACILAAGSPVREYSRKRS